MTRKCQFLSVGGKENSKEIQETSMCVTGNETLKTVDLQNIFGQNSSSNKHFASEEFFIGQTVM